MKKTLLLFAGLFAGYSASAQTITKTNNEPVAGDIHTVIDYDTTSLVPKNVGQAQTWNFSSLTHPHDTVTTTFVASSSVPSSSNCPGATVAEDTGGGDYTFFKAATGQFEMLGSFSTPTSGPSSGINFTNTATLYTWPFSYGNTFTDSFSGHTTGSSSFSGSSAGNSTVTATGTGTIVMPGGASYPNIIQVKSIRTSTVTFISPISGTFTSTVITYDYFEPGQKFPVLTVYVSYDDDGSGGTDISTEISVNKLITIGITDRNFDAQYAIYPNPAKDNFNIKLSNAANEKCGIEIYNVTGQLMKSVTLGTSSVIEEKVSLNELSAGVYIVKTTLGDKRSTRRLVID